MQHSLSDRLQNMEVICDLSNQAAQAHQRLYVFGLTQYTGRLVHVNAKFKHRSSTDVLSLLTDTDTKLVAPCFCSMQHKHIAAGSVLYLSLYRVTG